MEIREYDMMTDEAHGIRTAVFVVEKDYRPEFDEWDEPGRATHLLAFGNGRAVATCRLYPDLDHADQPGRWVIGRLAVVADERGHGIGKTVLAEAERLIRKAGGHVAAVHSEDKNFAMYEHLGYRITSELFDNGTHGWLVKALNWIRRKRPSPAKASDTRYQVMAAYGIIDTWRKTSGFIAVPPWCNGSTRVFGTLCLGSSPGGGAKRTMSRGLFRPPRHDRSESTYSYWHPLGYGSSESIAYDRNLAVRTAFSS